MTDAELAQMAARAQRALAGTDLQELFTQWRDVIGPSPEQMSELARAAVEALQNLLTPTPEQLQALEQAIRLLRPAPLVISGRLEALPPATAATFPGWEEFCSEVRPHLSAIGLIQRPRVSGYDARPIGTGFLISDRRLVTNSHVVDLLTVSTGALAARQAEVRFRREWDTVPEPAPVPIVAVVAADPDLDLAVLAIEPEANATPIGIDPSIAVATGMAVAAIGHPTDDSRDPAWVLPLFKNRFGVKRASPGEITGQREGRFYHDCTTLGGSSGSPVFVLDGARIAGVHGDGMFLARNHAIAGDQALCFLAESV
jgi:endonuclease G